MYPKGVELPKTYEYKTLVDGALYSLAEQMNAHFQEGWHPAPDMPPLGGISHALAVTLRREVSTFPSKGEGTAIPTATGDTIRLGPGCHRLTFEVEPMRAVQMTKGIHEFAEAVNQPEPEAKRGREVDDDGAAKLIDEHLARINEAAFFRP